MVMVHMYIYTDTLSHTCVAVEEKKTGRQIPFVNITHAKSASHAQTKMNLAWTYWSGYEALESLVTMVTISW